jgi:hypothetical protein
MQTEEEMKRYNDLVEKMESLKKYDAESFVRNISHVYMDFKSEEKVIYIIIKFIKIFSQIIFYRKSRM